ncbi:MAG: AAA family ATPase, partial [Anaerolineaceae bacterium]|nr:AAA family ATPase [Anaerolineaceae bacterium]
MNKILVCTSCQKKNPKNAAFCMHCGKALHVDNKMEDLFFSHLATRAPTNLAEKIRKTPIFIKERRIVTALLVSLVNEELLSSEQTQDPKREEFLRNALHDFSEIIFEHEGSIAQLWETALMAFFGAPVAHEDDPLRTLKSAMQILSQANKLSNQLKVNGEQVFKIKISLNTGPIIIDEVKSNLKFSFTSLDNTLECLTKIQTLTDPSKIIITEDTYRTLRSLVEVNRFDDIPLSCEMAFPLLYEVLNLQEKKDQFPLLNVSKKMIGRQKELDDLLELSETLMAGLGRIGVIYGDAGSGKSRLVQEWKQSIPNQKQNMNMIWAVGKSLPYGDKLAYHLIRSLIMSILNIQENTTDSEILFQLSKLINEVITSDNTFVFTTLTHLMHLPLETKIEQEFLHLQPQELEQQYRLALWMFIQSLARQKPLILILENLQWADASSIHLLNALMQITNISPVLICLISRPDQDTNGWQLISTAVSKMRSRLSELNISNLSPIETNELICDLLEVEQVPKSLVELILLKSEGNPLFIEETLRMLINRNVIERKKGHWTIQRSFSDIDIPDTLQGLLLARIDRLSRETKYVLNVASIIGREFQEKVLDDVLKSQYPQIQLNSQLSILEVSGLIKLAQIRPDVTYKFHHSLLQEVIYKTIVQDDVKLLHKSVADSLIKLYPEKQESLSPQLAYHFMKAQDRQKACLYYSIAAQNALNDHANLEAEQFYLKALSIVVEDQDKAELLSGLGQTLAQQVRHSEAIKVWREAIEIYQKHSNFSRMARLFAWMARSAWWNNEGDKNLSFCLEGLKTTENAPDSSDLAFLIHETGRAYYFNNDMEKAQTFCEKALKMAKKMHAFDVQAEVLATMGILPTLTPQQAIA